MSYTKRKIKETKAHAENIKAQGFRVFIAASGTHGCFTPPDGVGVITFQNSLGGFAYGFNYFEGSRTSGTSYRLDASLTLREMLDATPPRWAQAAPDWKPQTIANHLIECKASKYSEI